MNNKLTILLLSVLVNVFVISCRKNLGNKPADLVDVPKNTSSVLAEARDNMLSIISKKDFSDLDWNDAVVKKSNDEEMMVVVKSKMNADKSLIYVSGAKLKMYQWQNEVHFIVH